MQITLQAALVSGDEWLFKVAVKVEITSPSHILLKYHEILLEIMLARKLRLPRFHQENDWKIINFVDTGNWKAVASYKISYLSDEFFNAVSLKTNYFIIVERTIWPLNGWKERRCLCHRKGAFWREFSWTWSLLTKIWFESRTHGQKRSFTLTSNFSLHGFELSETC